MTLLLMGVLLVLPVVSPVALYQMVRHGPLPHPWWGGETVLGFTCTAFFVLAVLGVLIGGLVPNGGNLLPGLLMAVGALIGGVVGPVWGWRRAQARERPS
jgi:hypothetical protein